MIKENLHLPNKKIKNTGVLLLFTAYLLTFRMAEAQNRAINFENGTWEEIKTKAAKENKLIFLDAYARWCSVCKKMDKNVFSRDSVADYYNGNFINAKIDMESGEGPELARQYNVSVYPTLLFINSKGSPVHGTVGGLQPEQFIELAKEAQDPIKQNAGKLYATTSGVNDDGKENFNRTQLGFHISQYHKDFGIGLHVLSPYFLMKTIAIKAGTNIQWFEHTGTTETSVMPYQNIQLGMRGRSNMITQNIYVYGEGGAFIIVPNSGFSTKSSVVGGYGLFGFEFKIVPRLAYFIELGGVGTGAKADKIVSKPVYSNGFSISVGFNVGL